MKKYIDFILDLLAIDLKVSVENNPDVKIAKFVVDENNIPTILINPEQLKNEIELNFALTHELRHFYQWIVINDKNYFQLEDNETRKVWMKNFENYVPFETSERYTHQPVEIDAVCFTQLIMQTIYGIIMNDFKKDDVIFVDELMKLASDYTIDEILEVMKIHKIKKHPLI